MAYYNANGTSIAGTTAVAVTAGGTGASSAAQALANLGGQPVLAGVVSDGSLGVTVTGQVAAGTTVSNSQPMLDIRHPSFAGGAICDGGAHSIDAALQAAINAIASTGGEILIPGSPNACYLSNPNALAWGTLAATSTGSVVAGTNTLTVSSGSGISNGMYVTGPGLPFDSFVQSGGGTTTITFYSPAFLVPSPASGSGTYQFYSNGGLPITLFLQGQLRTGTTFTIPNYPPVNIIGRSGNSTSQFQGPGETASVFARPITGGGAPATGTLGTTISTTGLSTLATFTPSTMQGLVPGAAIDVVGTITCNLSSITRANNVVTATFSSACHIPAGVAITVAGVTDSSFNGAYPGNGTSFLGIASDYVVNTLTWNQTGSNSTSSGGTVTGMNEDAIETVQIVSTTSTTATANFSRAHNSTDQWGLVGLNMGFQGGGSGQFKDLRVTSDGLQIWMQQTYLTNLKNIGASSSACSGNLTQFPIEIGDSSFIAMDGVGFTTGCSPWGMRLTQPYNQGYTGSGPVYIDHSFLMSGIKLDHGASGIYAKNTVVEQANRGAVVVDPANYWNGNQSIVNLENVGLQDNATGIDSCMVYYETPVYMGMAVANVTLKNLGTAACTSNDYFTGPIVNDSPANPARYDQTTARGVLGTYSDGRVTETELRGEQAGMSPAIVPYATEPVTTNPASWTGCTVTPGQLAPDGTFTAGAFSMTNCGLYPWTTSAYTPAVGDRFIFGGWIYSPTHLQKAQNTGGGFTMDSAGSSHYTFSTGTTQSSCIGFDAGIFDDWWHPVVCVAMVATSDGTTNQTVRLNIGGTSNNVLEYWQPFAIFVPASANIPLAEIMRWRQQLLHGWVPSGATGGTMYSGYPIVLPGNPTQSNQAATKAYVDSAAPLASGSTKGINTGDGTSIVCSGGICSATASAPFTAKVASTPVNNTGSTTKNYLGTITVPASTMGATGQLNVQARVGACNSTGGIPTSACTGTGNTGTCTLQVYYSSTSGATGTTYAAFNTGQAAGAAKTLTASFTIANVTASSQLVDEAQISGNGSASGGSSTGSLNTANAWYLNFFMTNSVSADNCFLDSANAWLIP